MRCYRHQGKYMQDEKSTTETNDINSNRPWKNGKSKPWRLKENKRHSPISSPNLYTLDPSCPSCGLEVLFALSCISSLRSNPLLPYRSLFSLQHSSVHISHDLLSLQRRRFMPIAPIVVPFHLLLHRLHLLALPFPLGFAHLRLSVEQLVIWLAVWAPKTIPQRGELPVVVVEVQVVHGVAGRAIDETRIGNIFSVI